MRSEAFRVPRTRLMETNRGRVTHIGRHVYHGTETADIALLRRPFEKRMRYAYGLHRFECSDGIGSRENIGVHVFTNVFEFRITFKPSWKRSSRGNGLRETAAGRVDSYELYEKISRSRNTRYPLFSSTRHLSDKRSRKYCLNLLWTRDGPTRPAAMPPAVVIVASATSTTRRIIAV
jgi:hypothetical protein|uniref:Uncharacterized protein n=1 Tax=Sipha flava TaxID=143950 RepID=A0A2S2QKN0_9HEMI